MTDFHSLIIGPGAIGALVCAEVQAFSQVSVQRHRQSIHLKPWLESAQRTIDLNWQPDLNQQDVDIIWICCKAMHAVAAAKQALKSYPNASAVLLHNGMGPQQQLTDIYGSRIIWGSTTCGALSISDDRFLQTSQGHTRISSLALDRKPDYFKTLFDRSGSARVLQAEPTADIEAILWHKILINACVNPLTAWYGVRNGELASPEYQTEITSIADEVLQLMSAQQITPPKDPLSLINDVIRISAENWSSMAQDIRQGRITEIDYINGFLIAEGTRLKLDTPFLDKWYQRITTLQKS